METSLNNGTRGIPLQPANGFQNTHSSESASVPPQPIRMPVADDEEDEDERDLRAAGNPEQSFVPTNYRLNFDDGESSSASSCASPSRSATNSPLKTTSTSPVVNVGKDESMEVHGAEEETGSEDKKALPSIAQKAALERPKDPRQRRSPEVVRSRGEWRGSAGVRFEREQSHEEEEREKDEGGRFSMRQSKEDERWQKRRDDRCWAGGMDRAGRSRANVWAASPTSRDVEAVYVMQERYEKRVAAELSKPMSINRGPQVSTPERKKRKRSVSSSASSTTSSHGERRSGKRRRDRHRDRDSPAEKRRHKHSKHHKKEKNKKKHRKEESKRKEKKHKHRRRRSPSPTSTSASSSEGSGSDKDEWVELTNELRAEEAMKTRKEEAQVIGPQLPEHLLKQKQKDLYGQSAAVAGEVGKLDAQDRKHMLKGEAAAYAAYAAQGKRIPRRGEIGLSSNEISTYEKVGYVMSGTRHKAMEATRLRKENQILTADEKRLLNTFTSEQRQNREETVLKQFQELITSKKPKF